MQIRKDNISQKNQDIYWFVFPSLHALSDLHGANSKVTEQAQTILVDSLKNLASSMDIAYNGRALVLAATSDASHTRRARSILQSSDAPATPNADKDVSSRLSSRNSFCIVLFIFLAGFMEFNSRI